VAFSDRYTLQEKIGEGQSANVYQALDRQTDSLVAVKELKAHLRTDPVSIERFRREAQVTRHINHPRVVSVYDLVCEGDRTYLVMEYVRGRDLKTTLRLTGPLPWGQVVTLLAQVLDVLTACHGRNVVHRDLKPQNIVLDQEGGVKLLDFGVAKIMAASDLTQTGAALGSPEYMAPEQFAANLYDPRSDLYALGVTAFELLTGTVPYQSDSLAVLYQQHATAPLPSLRAARPEVPEWLECFVHRLLAKDRYQRYQSAQEALADLKSRRVLSRELPQLARRECVQCAGATPAEVPVCLHCGFNTFDAVKRGDFDVTCARDQDDEKLYSFAQAVFGLRKRFKRGRRTLLITGVDAFAAQVLARSAEKHEIFLSVAPHSPYGELRKAAPLALACFMFGWLWNWVARGWTVSGRYFFDALDALDVAQISLPAALLVVLSRSSLRREVRPLLPLREAVGGILREHGWVRELQPSLRPERTESTRTAVCALAESYLLLRKYGALDDALRDQLQAILRDAARLAALVSEVEQTLGAQRFLAWSNDYAAAERAEREDALSGAALRRRRLGEQLQAYFELQERYEAIVNRLTRLNALFYRLVARSLVLRLEVDADMRDTLREAVPELERDLQIAAEVQRELEALT